MYHFCESESDTLMFNPLNKTIMSIDEFKLNQKQYANEPVIFFFRVAGHNDRNDFDGMSREECIKKAIDAIPITEFDTDWNDTDDSGTYIPNPYETWCYVSMP